MSRPRGRHPSQSGPHDGTHDDIPKAHNRRSPKSLLVFSSSLHQLFAAIPISHSYFQLKWSSPPAFLSSPLVTSPHSHSASPAAPPSQARRVTGAICTSCFHCLFNTASPLRLSHPLHAPPINRLPPRQQRVCNVGPSSSLHQRQAVVSV